VLPLPRKFKGLASVQCHRVKPPVPIGVVLRSPSLLTPREDEAVGSVKTEANFSSQLLLCQLYSTKISHPFRLVRFSGRCVWLLSLGFLLGCCHELRPCRNVTTSEEISPNGQLKAVTFRRFCPEEHSITTHVSILRADAALPDGNGNVFGYDNEIAIRVSWLSNSRLAVYTYADPAKATKIEHAGSVSIEYSRIVETALVTPPPPNGAASIPSSDQPFPSPK